MTMQIMRQISIWSLCLGVAFTPMITDAQSPIRSFPPGTFQNRAALDAAPVASFQGICDIVSSASVWGSCARVYTAAQATTATSLCDLKDATTGTVSICTLRGSSTGYVDLTGSYCTGSTTPVLACAAAAGGLCKISKVYDQTGNGRDLVMATAANMPTLTFSALNGLPAMTFASASNQRLVSASFAVSSPLTMSIVYDRTGSTTTLSYFMSDNGSAFGIGADVSANNSMATFGTKITQAANDNTWHALQGVSNSATGAINTDGVDSGNQNTGNGAVSTGVRFGRSSAGVNVDGMMMEGGMWSGVLTSTQRGNLNTNQHGASGYNF